MKLSTSTRISLLYTGCTALILLWISLFIFFGFRRLGTNAEINAVKKLSPGIMKNRRLPQWVVMLNKEEFTEQFPSVPFERGFFMYEWKKYILNIQQWRAILKDSSSLASRENDLKETLLWWWFGALLITFLMSYFLAKRSLRDLHSLSEDVEKVSINNLSFIDSLNHLPENDELKKVSLSLEWMSNLLQRQVDDMKQFVAWASHELRTPLMMLRSSNELASKTKNYENLIQKNISTVEWMEQLVSWLLAMAQSEYVNTEKEQIDCHETIQWCITQVIHIAKKKDITMKYENKKSLVIKNRGGSLETIIKTLLDNAIKYTSGGWTITIHAEEWQISITDTWKGIAPENLKNIWKPFWQEDQSKWADWWYWLGLSLVKRLVENNWWEIDVTSSVGVWTTFTIAL